MKNKTLFYSIYFLFGIQIPCFGQQEIWYPLALKEDNEQIICINQSDKIKLKLDSTFNYDPNIKIIYSRNYDHFILEKKISGYSYYVAINRKGEVIHQFQKDERAEIISDKHILVRKLYATTNNRVGLMDLNFQWITSTYQYKDIIYDHGVYVAIDQDSVIVLLDSEGKQYLKTNYKSNYLAKGDLSDGLLVINSKNGSDSQYLLMDTKGNIVIPPGKFAYISEFHQGVAYATMKIEGNKPIKKGYIDTKGDWLFEFDPIDNDYFYGNYYRDGLIVARDSQSKLYGYMDFKKKWVIPPKYIEANTFRNGLAVADPLNEELGEQKMSDIHSFVRGHYGLPYRTIINTKGKRMYEGYFSDLYMYGKELMTLFINYQGYFIVFDRDFNVIYDNICSVTTFRDLYSIERSISQCSTLQDSGEIELSYSAYDPLDISMALKLFEKINPQKLTFKFKKEEEGSCEFPMVITQMDHLEYLDLSSNNILSIPDEIGNLKNLKELNLSYNKISKFPNALFSINSLERLIISNNDFSQQELFRIRESFPAKVKITFR